MLTWRELAQGERSWTNNYIIVITNHKIDIHQLRIESFNASLLLAKLVHVYYYFSHHSRWQANRRYPGGKKKKAVIHYPWISEQRIINFLVS